MRLYLWTVKGTRGYQQAVVAQSALAAMAGAEEAHGKAYCVEDAANPFHSLNVTSVEQGPEVDVVSIGGAIVHNAAKLG